MFVFSKDTQLARCIPNVVQQRGTHFFFWRSRVEQRRSFYSVFSPQKSKQIKNKRQHKIHPKMGKTKNRTNRHPTVFWYRVLCFCCSVVLFRLLSSYSILFVSFFFFKRWQESGVWISPSLLWRSKIDYMHTMWRTVLFFRHIRILTAIPCSLMSVEEKNHYEFECHTRLLPLP